MVHSVDLIAAMFENAVASSTEEGVESVSDLMPARRTSAQHAGGASVGKLQP